MIRSTDATKALIVVIISTGCEHPDVTDSPGVVPPRPDASVQVAETPPPEPPTAVWNLIGSFETRYRYVGKYAGRASNIETATSRLNRDLKPGEILSFNAAVGVRNVRNGFVTAPGILMGRVVEDVGGGTCQVASTVHAAARMSGVYVMERRPHSRLSKYIEPGLDATVSFPAGCMEIPPKNCELIDLKIQNPYTHPIRLRMSVREDGEEKILRASFEGAFKPIFRCEYSHRKGHTPDKSHRRWFRTGKRLDPDYRRRVQSSDPGWFVTSKVSYVPLVKGADLHDERWYSRYAAVDEVWEVGARWDADAGAPWDR